MTDWNFIPSTDGKYLASDTGLIRRAENDQPLAIQRNGSVTITLADSRQVSRSAAKLVWEAWHGPIPRGMYIRRRNGDLADCSLDNLFLSRQSKKRGLTDDQIQTIFQRAAEGEKLSLIARSQHIPDSMVHSILCRDVYRDVPIPKHVLQNAQARLWTRKLSQADADAIRAEVRSGASQASLARHFGVSVSMVSRIVSGERW